jgi:hypothetical protein
VGSQARAQILTDMGTTHWDSAGKNKEVVLCSETDDSSNSTHTLRRFLSLGLPGKNFFECI